MSIEGTLPELEEFEPEPLTLERMKALQNEREFMMEMAYRGELGFQMVMMHPEGHVQLAEDIMNLVDFYVHARYQGG